MWTELELQAGKRIKIAFPKNHKVKVFRVASTSRPGLCRYQRLESIGCVGRKNGMCLALEEFHREAKQLTGLEKCQCRLPRIVRNHIACAFFVWIRLMREAHETGQTLYVKHGMFSVREQLKLPTLKNVSPNYYKGICGELSSAYRGGTLAYHVHHRN